MHPGIKLRHVRAFLDIAADGGISAAARSQGISQPALSRTLAELEAMLGATLFRREGRRLILTEQGALFRHHAGPGLQSLEAAAQALHPGQTGGVLRVGVLPTAATRLFPRVALRLQALAPDIVLTMMTGSHSFLMRLLREGEIDLILGRMPAAAEMAGLTFDHLYEEGVILAARAGHPFAIAPVAVALAACPLILPTEDAVIRRPVDDYLASLGLAGLRPAFRTVALAIGRGIVLQSDALWFISRGVVADELDRGEMLVLPTGAAFLAGAVGVTLRQQPTPPPATELLIRLARETVREGIGP